jgi:hypothetical protein
MEELESATKTTVEEKDVTSVEKKLAAAAINAASGLNLNLRKYFRDLFKVNFRTKLLFTVEQR